MKPFEKFELDLSYEMNRMDVLSACDHLILKYKDDFDFIHSELINNTHQLNSIQLDLFLKRYKYKKDLLDYAKEYYNSFEKVQDEKGL